MIQRRKSCLIADQPVLNKAVCLAASPHTGKKIRPNSDTSRRLERATFARSGRRGSERREAGRSMPCPGTKVYADDKNRRRT